MMIEPIIATAAKVNKPADGLLKNVSAFTRIIGARKPPTAPNKFTNPIPAANAEPDNICVGMVQKTG